MFLLWKWHRADIEGAQENRHGIRRDLPRVKEVLRRHAQTLPAAAQRLNNLAWPAHNRQRRAFDLRQRPYQIADALVHGQRLQTPNIADDKGVFRPAKPRPRLRLSWRVGETRSADAVMRHGH